jgi:hypothetical protein
VNFSRQVVIFGGKSVDGKVSNKIQGFDIGPFGNQFVLNDSYVSAPKGTIICGFTIGGRAFHTAVIDSKSNKMIVLGGFDGTNTVKSIFIFDFDKNVWADSALSLPVTASAFCGAILDNLLLVHIGIPAPFITKTFSASVNDVLVIANTDAVAPVVPEPVNPTLAIALGMVGGVLVLGVLGLVLFLIVRHRIRPRREAHESIMNQRLSVQIQKSSSRLTGIELVSEIGKGFFGTVFLGEWGKTKGTLL